MKNSMREPGRGSPIPVVSIVGHSGSGKTTLLERLIHELKQRGYRLAVIKHHHHPDLQFDTPGKDSWRFAQAGADHIVLAGPGKVAHIRTFEKEPTLEHILTVIQDVDLILTEGYKHADAPKIEVSRGETASPLISAPEGLIAMASDRHFDVDVPQFNLEDIAGLATFLEARFLT
jgi:molybdopterin-guanine dinucleotide biosynthesis protein MobB